MRIHRQDTCLSHVILRTCEVPRATHTCDVSHAKCHPSGQHILFTRTRRSASILWNSLIRNCVGGTVHVSVGVIATAQCHQFEAEDNLPWWRSPSTRERRGLFRHPVAGPSRFRSAR